MAAHFLRAARERRVAVVREEFLETREDVGRERRPVRGGEADGDTQRALQALRLGLAEQGWREPGDIVIECRFNAIDAIIIACALFAAWVWWKLPRTNASA